MNKIEIMELTTKPGSIDADAYCICVDVKTKKEAEAIVKILEEIKKLGGLKNE